VANEAFIEHRDASSITRSGGNNEMVQRVALLIGGLGAIAVLSIALGFGGFVSAGAGTDSTTIDQASDPAPAADVGVQAEQQAAAPQPKVVTKTVKDKVYVLPTPKPKVVRIDNGPTNKPTANQPTKPNKTVTKSNSNQNAEPRDDGEHESADHERGDRGDGAERSGREGARQRGGDD